MIRTHLILTGAVQNFIAADDVFKAAKAAMHADFRERWGDRDVRDIDHSAYPAYIEAEDRRVDTQRYLSLVADALGGHELENKVCTMSRARVWADAYINLEPEDA